MSTDCFESGQDQSLLNEIESEILNCYYDNKRLREEQMESTNSSGFSENDEEAHHGQSDTDDTGCVYTQPPLSPDDATHAISGRLIDVNDSSNHQQNEVTDSLDAIKTNDADDDEVMGQFDADCEFIHAPYTREENLSDDERDFSATNGRNAFASDSVRTVIENDNVLGIDERHMDHGQSGGSVDSCLDSQSSIYDGYYGDMYINRDIGQQPTPSQPLGNNTTLQVMYATENALSRSISPSSNDSDNIEDEHENAALASDDELPCEPLVQSDEYINGREPESIESRLVAFNREVQPQSEKRTEDTEMPGKLQSPFIQNKMQNYEKQKVHDVKSSFDHDANICYEDEPQGCTRQKNEVERGVFENEPVSGDEYVHEYDQDASAELPEAGYTRNILQRFSEIQRSAKGIDSNKTQTNRVENDFDVDGGIFESKPVIRNDVVRASYSEEKIVTPQKGHTKNMAEIFQSNSMISNTKNVHRDKGPLHIDRDQLHSSGVIENEPSVSGAVRADDAVEEVVPQRGLAHKMAMKFQEIANTHEKSQSKLPDFRRKSSTLKDENQISELTKRHSRSSVDDSVINKTSYMSQSNGVSCSENDFDTTDSTVHVASTRKLVDHFKHLEKVSGSKSKVVNSTPKKEGSSRFKTPQQDKCDACHKTVYVMERFEFNKSVFHKTCFKCSHCKRQLTPATHAVNENQLYCMTHFKQMFKEKGNYDEGFGRNQYKKHWKSEPNLNKSADE